MIRLIFLCPTDGKINSPLISVSFVNKVNSGDYEINFKAINCLKGINLSSFDSSLDGLAAEYDLITDPTNHQKLFSDVENVIDVLKVNSYNRRIVL